MNMETLQRILTDEVKHNKISGSTKASKKVKSPK